MSNPLEKLAQQDHLVCTCMGVMYSEIVEAIKRGYRDFDALSELFGVGTGCSSCVPEVYEILDQILPQEYKR